MTFRRVDSTNALAREVSDLSHAHRYIEEQQTRHRFCELCGHHDPPDGRCADRPSGLWSMLTDPKWLANVRGTSR